MTRRLATLLMLVGSAVAVTSTKMPTLQPVAAPTTQPVAAPSAVRAFFLAKIQKAGN